MNLRKIFGTTRCLYRYSFVPYILVAEAPQNIYIYIYSNISGRSAHLIALFICSSRISPFLFIFLLRFDCHLTLFLSSDSWPHVCLSLSVSQFTKYSSSYSHFSLSLSLSLRQFFYGTQKKARIRQDLS